MICVDTNQQYSKASTLVQKVQHLVWYHINQNDPYQKESNKSNKYQKVQNIKMIQMIRFDTINKVIGII